MTDQDLRRLYWGAFAMLLAAVLAGAWLSSRAGWSEREPYLAAGEATVLMQAASLAHDFDLAYTREDFDRLTLEWRGEPPDLELASGSAGRRITYHRPFPYALYLAPFVRVSPQKGFAVANALLLVLVAVFAARTLKARRRRNSSRPAPASTMSCAGSVPAGRFSWKPNAITRAIIRSRRFPIRSRALSTKNGAPLSRHPRRCSRAAMR